MATIHVSSGQIFPSWTFTHYLDSLETNYRRLAIISRVVALIDEGYGDEEFKVGRRSIELFSSEPIHEDQFRDFSFFFGKADDYGEFWRRIRALNRPAVFVRKRNGPYYESVYRFDGPEALSISRASLQSPFKITAEGLAEVLDALRYWKTGADRAQERHESRQRVRGAQARNLEADASIKEANALAAKMHAIERTYELVEKIDKSSLSPEAKQVVLDQVRGIADLQSEKNQAIEAKINYLSDDSEELL